MNVCCSASTTGRSAAYVLVLMSVCPYVSMSLLCRKYVLIFVCPSFVFISVCPPDRARFRRTSTPVHRPYVFMPLCPYALMPLCPYVCMRVCPYVRMSVCPCARVPVCLYVFTWVYARMSVCLYVFTCVHVLMSICPSSWQGAILVNEHNRSISAPNICAAGDVIGGYVSALFFIINCQKLLF